MTQLASVGVTHRHLVWPLLQSLWYSALPHSDWLHLWDNIITCGPGLLVTCLVSTVTCLARVLMRCSCVTHVQNLMSSTLAVNMKQLLQTSYLLLDKYRTEIDKIVVKHVTFDSSYPASIILDSDNKSVLKTLYDGEDTENIPPSQVSSRVSKRSSSHYNDNDVIRQALAVSPPAVPRLRSNTKHYVDNKENDEDILAPLKPIYNVDQEVVDDEISEIQQLLQKAKVVRQVISSKRNI